MIDEAHIDCDDDGFHLILTGDFDAAFARYLASGEAQVNLRLSQDAALQLAGQVRATIGPWADDRDAALASYIRRDVGEQVRATHGPTAAARFDEDVTDPDELAREGADLARKAARENGIPA